jgi:hypothetical protein
MPPEESVEVATHSETTIALAKQEHAEHMEGMDEAAKQVRNRPLLIRAYEMADPNAPTTENVKTVHFVRHGQGFHNLMADLAKQSGRTWVQVCCPTPQILKEKAGIILHQPAHFVSMHLSALEDS